MTPSIRTLPALLAIAFLGACAPASRQAATAPLDPPRDGRTLLAYCAATPTAGRMDCYDKALLGIMRGQNVTAAMTALDQLSALDTDVMREGHMYAHSIGLAAYTGPGQLESSFRQCMPIFQSGCYHGVIQSHFSAMAGSGGLEALSSEKINDVCKDFRKPGEGIWLLFQCVHGMGHGLSQLTDHELKRTLSGCDRISDTWEREGCYGGAFMENMVQAVAPHHAVGRPEMAMDHSSMPGTSHGTPAAKAKLIDPDDPLYPCSALTDQYLTSCYMMQTSIVLHFNKANFADAARTCDRVQERYRGICYQSLGRDASAYSLRDFSRAVTMCSNGDPQYQSWCHNGFVKNVIDVDADFRSGVGYCRILQRAQDKTSCYRAIGEQILALMPEEAKRAAACAEIDVAYRDVCTAGAGLPKAAPRGP